MLPNIGEWPAFGRANIKCLNDYSGFAMVSFELKDLLFNVMRTR